MNVERKGILFPVKKRLKKLRRGRNDPTKQERVVPFYLDSFLEPEETNPARVYTNALARMELHIAKKGFPKPPPTPTHVMKRALQKVKRLLEMSSSTKSISWADPTSLAHLGGGWTSLEPLIRVVYLYTLEDPPVYKMVNDFLATKSMWDVDPNDSDGHYSGYSSGITLDKEGYEALGGYAIALIQALFALYELALVDGVTECGGSGEFKITLFRGLPEAAPNPFHAPGDAYRYNRWTTFGSTTTDPDVASQFGETVYVAFRSSSEHFTREPRPIFFDIGWMSEYPEESEWLMLPGVSPNVQAHRARFEYGNITAWFIRAQWKQSGYHLKNPDHPNARQPEFDGVSHNCCLAFFCYNRCVRWLLFLVLFATISVVVVYFRDLRDHP